MIKFNSKIMLFGEYTVLHGSDALLIPFSKFSGELDFMKNGQNNDDQIIQSNKSLNKFLDYLQTILSETNLLEKFKLNQFKYDLNNGLYFESNIPVGYGVGSSGALTAALFSRYSEKTVENSSKEKILSLRKGLALMESFYHGNSSGLDPLVSYLNQGIFVTEDKVKPENVDYSLFHPFLIDTQVTRSTGEMVKLYQEKCKNPEYMHRIKSELVQINNKCIDYLIHEDQINFSYSLKELSGYQLKYFKEMILPEFEPVWKLGLESDNFYLKLCGAGGGGYILGFTHNFEALNELRNELKLNIIEI